MRIIYKWFHVLHSATLNMQQVKQAEKEEWKNKTLATTIISYQFHVSLSHVTRKTFMGKKKKEKAIENQIITVPFIVLPFTTADAKLVVRGKEICCWVLRKGLW